MAKRKKVLPRAEKNADNNTARTGRVLRQKSKLAPLAAPATNTHGWLAQRIGVSRQRIGQLVANPDWKWGGGPWPATILPAVQAWMAERRAAANATSEKQHAAQTEDDTINQLTRNPERVAKIKALIERTAYTRVQRGLLEGSYLKKEDIESERVHRIYAVRNKMQELPLRAALIAMKPEAEVAATLRLWMQEICDSFAAN